jgi:hypothetical protein
MWWGMGGVLAVIYIALFIVLGIQTIRRGHWLLFFIGSSSRSSGSSAR